MYVPNNGVSKYIKQKLIELKKEIDTSAIIPGNLNTLPSVVDRWKQTEYQLEYC